MSNKPTNEYKKTSIGGQALMEGIMMRGPETTAMAIRKADGQIVLESFPTAKSGNPSKVSRIPFVRGIFNMVSSLKVGYKCLMRSADIALADLEEADKDKKETVEENSVPAAETPGSPTAETTPVSNTVPDPISDPVSDPISDPETAPEASAFDTVTEPASAEEAATVVEPAEKVKEEVAPVETGFPKKEKAPGTKKNSSFSTTIVMIVGVILGVALAIGLFVVVPSYLYLLFANLTGIDTESTAYGWSLLRSVFEGVLKIFIIILYMFLVSRMKDIRRVFMYHGAEHKTIFCYEQGLPLTVDNIRGQRRFHPRCGTSFLILVMLVSVVLGFFVPAFLSTWLRVLIKVALIPLTVGISYELIKLAGRKDNWFTHAISAPGMWLQHITTVEPDDSMIECAIAAMTEVIPEDSSKDQW